MMTHDRSHARRIALQALYQLDVHGQPFIEDGLQAFVDASTEDPKLREIAYFMAKSAWAYHKTADEWIGRIATEWPVYRMAVVDRNILRLAVWEMANFSATPPKVVVDEAIEMGKEFSTADSGNFINGILDAIMKEYHAITGKKP
jgi:transcription antitermination factor NusB